MKNLMKFVNMTFLKKTFLLLLNKYAPIKIKMCIYILHIYSMYDQKSEKVNNEMNRNQTLKE